MERPKPPENVRFCSGCGLSATVSKFEREHVKCPARFQNGLLAVGMVAAFIVFGVILVQRWSQ